MERAETNRPDGKDTQAICIVSVSTWQLATTDLQGDFKIVINVLESIYRLFLFELSSTVDGAVITLSSSGLTI